MDLISRLLITAFLSMITMTGFSYLISKAFCELYKEPVLLRFFLKKLNFSMSKTLRQNVAWICHYLIGLGFVIAYHFIWEGKLLPLTWLTGLFLGTVSGVMGIIGWILIFQYTRHKPRIDFKGYYIQLLVVHIIFGLTAFASYIYL